MISIIKTLMEASSAVNAPVHEYALLPTGEVVFSPELLESCKTNVCGNYNKSWTCPPACESPQEQRGKILSYKQILLFTTVHNLEDSFDYDGMTEGRNLHAALTAELKKLSGAPVYGAGSCPICKDAEGNNRCAFPAPCPFPEHKIGSIEAAGINVTELSKAAGIAYNNGPNTVTFFSMALLNDVN
ncbi:MAG: DUF2284 domain-containing protein [Treponema sp.]|nr:DUF2284 domain-containing protein [Treponema sp.]